jgi:DNA-binding LacI/PurR family transcriptional regulator
MQSGYSNRLQRTGVTIKDVAREAGVNVSTASRALAGSYGVHRATRERILRIAEALHYQANSIARGLVTGRSKTLGLLISDIRNPFFAEVARGVEDSADAAGYQVFVCNADLDATKQMRYFQALRARNVDGVIMNSISNLTAAQRDELARAGIPVVLLNRPGGKGTGFSIVSSDNRAGGQLAASYLIRLGHRAIGHVTGPREHGNLSMRCKGFLGVCEKAGIAPAVLYGEHTYEGGLQLTRKLLNRNAAITAMFAANDVMAFGALRAIVEMGRRAPDDVSVIGFDDLQLSCAITPGLTTIRQPMYEIGRAAAQILLSSSTLPEQRVFGVTLVERQSCRAITGDHGPIALQTVA